MNEYKLSGKTFLGEADKVVGGGEREPILFRLSKSIKSYFWRICIKDIEMGDVSFHIELSPWGFDYLSGIIFGILDSNVCNNTSKR